jgi:HK97 family phage prohead protease
MEIKKATKDAKQLASSEAFKVKQHSNAVFIEGFANKATVDRGNDIIASDAWELDNYMANPIILFNHGLDTLGGTPVGKATEVRPTDEGLYIKVRLSNSQAPGIKMVRDLVEERILRAFSVGFEPKESENIEVDGKSVKKITKGELFEVSIVGVPMNQDSLFELTEKALQTKSLYELKHDYLEAIKCPIALKIHEAMGEDAEARNEKVKFMADDLGYKINTFKDKLAGDGEFDEEELKTIGEYLQVELQTKMEDDPDKEDDDKPKDKEKTADPEDSKAKDFQECVSSKIPKLIDEGKERDEAVAAAIAMCQEEGKCQLTPESKLATYSAVFDAMDGEGIDTLNLEGVEFVTQSVDAPESTDTKGVDEDTQVNQPPTEAIQTDVKGDDFGNPFLDGQKQTNVLLGALIQEFQQLTAKLDGILSKDALESEVDAAKVSDTTTDSTEEPSEAIVDKARKRLADLDKRLKNLSC